MIVLGAGSGGAPAGMLKLGHFAALRRTGMTEVDEQSKPMADVFVGGEGLARGPVEVVGTLLHEAAHALAGVRGKDTGQQGRWRNAKFKALAEELGIEVTKDSCVGWSPTRAGRSTSSPSWCGLAVVASSATQSMSCNGRCPLSPRKPKSTDQRSPRPRGAVARRATGQRAEDVVASRGPGLRGRPSLQGGTRGLNPTIRPYVWLDPTERPRRRVPSSTPRYRLSLGSWQTLRLSGPRGC